jgi:hypothetical protein
LEGESPSAETITLDLRAIGNKLTVWEIDNEIEIEEAALAYISKCEHLETIDLVIIEPSLLNANSLKVIESTGDTLYSDFARKHRDIIELDYDSLGRVWYCIVESMRLKLKSTAEPTVRFTKPKLIKILEQGISKNKIKSEELKEGISKHLGYSK